MKKPDSVAETPGLLPYGTNVSAPAIKVKIYCNEIDSL